MPTVQGGPDQFDHGFDSGVDYDTVFGTPVAVTTPTFQDRVNTMELTAAGANLGVRETITGSQTIGWASVAFAIDAKPGGSSRVCNFGTVSGAVASVYCASTGLFVADMPGSSPSTEFALADDTFVWLEFLYDCVNHDANLYVNDNLEISVAGSGTGTTIDFHQLVNFAGDPTGIVKWYSYWSWGFAADLTDIQGMPSAGPEKQAFYGYRTRRVRR